MYFRTVEEFRQPDYVDWKRAENLGAGDQFELRIREGIVNDMKLDIDISINALDAKHAIERGKEMLLHEKVVERMQMSGVTRIAGMIYHVTAHGLHYPVASFIHDIEGEEPLSDKILRLLSDLPLKILKWLTKK